MKKFMYSSLLLISSLMLLSCSDSTPLTFNKADYKGQWLIVNYWATWCQPCITELPALNAFSKKYAKDKISVIGINFDGKSTQELTEFLEPLELNFPLFSQFPLADYQLSLPQVLPTTYIIAPDGRLKNTLVGPQDEASLLTALKVAQKAA